MERLYTTAHAEEAVAMEHPGKAPCSEWIRSIAFVFATCVTLVLLQAPAAAQDVTGTQATKRLPSYFPNTEEVRPDEMRITALGTGLPTPITRAQKSTAWMVELGNGDVFLFDIGTGSLANLGALETPFSYLERSSSAICTSTISAIWMPCSSADGSRTGRCR